MRILGISGCLIAAAIVGGMAQARAATVLFDGTAGVSPEAQGWLHPPIGGSETIGASFTTFDTSASAAIRNGYALFAPVALDKTTGYTLRFDLAVTNEAHTNNDRAGVSLIALGSDHHGVELSFWGDHVWAQNYTSDFSHGPDALFNSLTGITQYELAVVGDNYSVSANGGHLFSGTLQDYSPSGVTIATIPIYSLNNFLFLGDDTTEAKGGFEWQYASLTTNTVTVPEAGTGSLLLGGALALLGAARFARRRR